MFKILVVEDENLDEEKVMEDCLEAGAEDFEFSEQGVVITSSPTEFGLVREGLEKKGYSFASAQIEMVPQTTSRLDLEEQKVKMRRLLDALEENDDVQDVWHNLENEDEL